MRTTLDLPQGLIEEAMSVSHVKTKTALIIQALEEFVRQNKQAKCLGKGINKVGIPDLIIAQNSIQNKAPLYTRDKHFQLVSKHLPLHLFTE